MEDITITISKNRIFVPVVAVLLLWPAHGVAAEEAGTHERARGSFVKGLAAYQSRKWRVAEAELRASFEAEAHATTACLLTSTYLALRDPKNVLIYSVKALEGDPPLPEEYRTRVEELSAWARISVADPYYMKIPGDSAHTPRPKVAQVRTPELIRARKDLLAQFDREGRVEPARPAQPAPSAEAPRKPGDAEKVPKSAF